MSANGRVSSESLRRVGLFENLDAEEIDLLASVSTSRALASGEYLFMLGDAADRLYVVLEGKMELCFPMSLGDTVKDVSVEVAPPGRTLGWSALVKPYRMTLSARAAELSRVGSFPRRDLLELFEREPRTGYRFLTKISELVGIRLLKVQALWARELQRTLASEAGRREG